MTACDDSFPTKTSISASSFASKCNLSKSQSISGNIFLKVRILRKNARRNQLKLKPRNINRNSLFMSRHLVVYCETYKNKENLTSLSCVSFCLVIYDS